MLHKMLQFVRKCNNGASLGPTCPAREVNKVVKGDAASRIKEMLLDVRRNVSDALHDPVKSAVLAIESLFKARRIFIIEKAHQSESGKS